MCNRNALQTSPHNAVTKPAFRLSTALQAHALCTTGRLAEYNPPYMPLTCSQPQQPQEVLVGLWGGQGGAACWLP